MSVNNDDENNESSQEPEVNSSPEVNDAWGASTQKSGEDTLPPGDLLPASLFDDQGELAEESSDSGDLFRKSWTTETPIYPTFMGKGEYGSTFETDSQVDHTDVPASPGQISDSILGRKSENTRDSSRQGTSAGADNERGDASGLDGSLRIGTRVVTGGYPFGYSPDADYEVVSKLAEGGMGIVYIARQLSLNRQLAIKTLKPMSEKERTRLANFQISQVTRHRREMFLSEALVTANLVHPNIVPIHDLFQTGDGTPFYSMKQVEGTPWNKVIKSKMIEENLDILLKVADAVAYAHHNGVINRDLKPENIMLGEFGEVFVLD